MAAESFTTFNQFDKRFSEFAKFGSDRTACPLFGLITCYNFMLTGDLSQLQHESNIYASVTNYMTKDVPKYMLFDELLVLTNGSLNLKEINATTPELITTGVMGYENIFRFGYDQNYCILFLKNRNYIAFLYKNTPEGEKYAIRDCHENTQRTFGCFEDMRQFLNNTYQFEQSTIVAGVAIPEFGNIEFLVIDIPFELINVDPGLVDETIEQDKTFVEEKPVPISGSEVPDVAKFTVDDQIAFSLGMEGNEDDYVDFI